jgi:RNA polymerase sigma-70 factor (ECF subfamily)
MSDPDDTERFYAELWPHRAQVARVARILARGEADAEDLAQEAMLKAYRAIASLAPGSNAPAWLMTVLRNTHLDRLRARHGRDEVSLEAADVDVADPHVPAEDEAAWGDPARTLAGFEDQEIIQCLKELPREICWTLLLVDVQGLDDREAAAVLGVPTGTIKSRLHRGWRMLREALLPLARQRNLGSARSAAPGARDQETEQAAVEKPDR